MVLSIPPCICWPFVCLYFENCPFWALGPFLTWVTGLLYCLVVNSFSRILDTRLLADTWFANIFLRSLSCFLDSVLQSTEVLNFDNVKYVYFLLWLLVLLVSKKPCLIQVIKTYTCVFFQVFYSFSWNAFAASIDRIVWVLSFYSVNRSRHFSAREAMVSSLNLGSSCPGMSPPTTPLTHCVTLDRELYLSMPHFPYL